MAEARAIPPWVHINEGSDLHTPLVPPVYVQPVSKKHYKPGRRWDHLRNAEPAFMGEMTAERAVSWQALMESGPQYERSEGARIVSQQWMDENRPHLNPDYHSDDDEEKPEVHRLTAKGMMYKGKWLISPERQEQTVRLFWVSPLILCWQFSYDAYGRTHSAR